MRKRTALAQVLALDPDIILMDEPFSALDVQTRQLMENEVLELWATGGGRRARKAVLFITHDLDEAIATSDRVVVLSAVRGRVRLLSGRAWTRMRASGAPPCPCGSSPYRPCAPCARARARSSARGDTPPPAGPA